MKIVKKLLVVALLAGASTAGLAATAGEAQAGGYKHRHHHLKKHRHWRPRFGFWRRHGGAPVYRYDTELGRIHVRNKYGRWPVVKKIRRHGALYKCAFWKYDYDCDLYKSAYGKGGFSIRWGRGGY